MGILRFYTGRRLPGAGRDDNGLVTFVNEGLVDLKEWYEVTTLTG